MMIVRTKFSKKITIECDWEDMAVMLTKSLNEQLWDNEDYQNNRIIVDREGLTVRVYFYQDMTGSIPELRI